MEPSLQQSPQVQQQGNGTVAAASTAGAAAGQWSHRCSSHRRCSSRATELSLQQAPQVQQQGNGAIAAAVTAGAAAGQWNCRCSRHRRCSSRATDAKVRCTIRCISNESKNRKVHCQERRSPAHPTQTRIVASSSAIPVQELSHRQVQYQFEHSPRDPSGTHWTALPQRPGGNGKCKRQRKLEQCCKSVEYTCSEKGTASWDRAASQRDCKLGQSCKSKGLQVGTELQVGESQGRVQIEPTVTLLQPDYHHRPWVTSNHMLRT